MRMTVECGPHCLLYPAAGVCGVMQPKLGCWGDALEGLQTSLSWACLADVPLQYSLTGLIFGRQAL